MLLHTSVLLSRRPYRQTEKRLLQRILKDVSRSFYLSLRVLPGTVRQQVSLAYLFCRAADTIADTHLLPRSQRLPMLQAFRHQFLLDSPSVDDIARLQAAVCAPHGSTGDAALLRHLADCFAVFERFSASDRQLVRELVLTLTHGMAMDLSYFPGETAAEVCALPDMATLDLYTYYVAGVVGKFWTELHKEYIPVRQSAPWQELCVLGVRFGKGLQMTNILKDLGRDIAVGRCYLPAERLEQCQVRVEDLTRPGVIHQLRPLILQLACQTLEHLDQAYQYVLQLPYQALRLRLSCMWPLLFALQTLEVVCQSDALLSPETRVKISRGAVYRTVFWSLWCLMSPAMFTQYYKHLRQRLVRSLSQAEGHRVQGGSHGDL